MYYSKTALPAAAPPRTRVAQGRGRGPRRPHADDNIRAALAVSRALGEAQAVTKLTIAATARECFITQLLPIYRNTSNSIHTLRREHMPRSNPRLRA